MRKSSHINNTLMLVFMLLCTQFTSAAANVNTISNNKWSIQEEIPKTPEKVLNEILENPEEVFHEGVEQMTENMGGQFGFIDVKESGDGFFQFSAGEEGAYMPLNTRFKDFGGDGRRQQAFWMRFKPDPDSNLSFTFMGMAEVVISFEGDGSYCTYVQEVIKDKINDFQFESDKWYNIIFATDNDMILRVIAWEDDNFKNQMFYEKDLFIGMDDLFESNWKLTIGFNPNTTLSVSDYSVYIFDSFVQNPGLPGDSEGETSGSENDQQENSQDVMKIIGAIVSEPQVLYKDDLDSLPERGYTAYSDVDAKNPGDGFEFITMENSDGFSFLTSLMNVVPTGERKDNMNQAVLIAFKTDNPLELRFALSAEETVFIAFEDDAMPAFGLEGRTDVGMMPFIDQTQSYFRLEAGQWYYTFMAVNTKSEMRVRLWQIDNPDNYTNYEVKLAEFGSNDTEREKFLGQNWQFNVEMGNHSQFNMSDFRVLDFDEIIGLE